MKRWHVAAAGFTALLLAGMVYAWSILSAPIAQEFPHWSKAQLSMTFTVVMIFFCLGSVAAGFLSARVSARTLVWIAAALFLTGFLSAARIRTPAALWLSFGAVCGTASGLTYNAVLGTIGRWYPDRPGLISGILLMGFGFSSFLIGKLYQAFTPVVSGGWRRSFLVLGAVTAAVLALCAPALKRPGTGFVPPAGGKTRRRAAAAEVATGQMLRRADFWLFYLWAAALSAAGLALVSQAGGIAREIGAAVPPAAIATTVGLISIFNGLGRVLSGGLFDRLGRRAVMLLDCGCFLLAGLLLTAALRAGSYALMTAGFVVGGIAYGGVSPTNSAFTGAYYGPRHYPLNFSVVNSNLMIASFGSTVAGALYDRSGTYRSTDLMIAALALLGAAASAAITVCDRKRRRA